MKVKTFFILSFIFKTALIAQVDSAKIYANQLNYSKSEKILKKRILNNQYKSDFMKSLDYYNLACTYSLSKKNKSCFDNLKKCKLLNETVFDGFYCDPDFFNVSHLKEWQDLLIEFRQKNCIKIIDSSFIILSQIAINDQAYYTDLDFYEKKRDLNRNHLNRLWKLKDSLNETNLSLVNYFIEHGYNVLSDTVVGSKFANKCFLVIQHSNIKTMEYYLPIIKNLVDKKQTRGENYALLYDRVSVYKNVGVQYYGSQINTETKQPYPIKDERNVDKRRKELGMEPLFDYLLKFGIHYNSKP